VADAIDTMTGVAAPLLAGFTITLTALVVQESEKFRWPSVSVLMLSIAAVFLITTVQAGFWIRFFRPTLGLEPPSYGRWIHAARYTYGAGIFLLLAGLATVLAPDDGQTTLRWLAVAAVGIAALAEIVWTLYSERVSRRSWPR
jgi:hypothetical protein